MNAKAMAETIIERGYRIVSGGTDNHLMLVDLIKQEITGKVAEAALGEANITVNKNEVPNDPKSPFVTSGIRIGTPAITTRGFTETDSRDLATWMCDILDDVTNETVISQTKIKVTKLCRERPVYEVNAR